MKTNYIFLTLLGMALYLFSNAQSLREETIMPNSGTKISIVFPLKFSTVLQTTGTQEYSPPGVDICGHHGGGFESVSWHFDTFTVDGILTVYSSASRNVIDTTRLFPIPTTRFFPIPANGTREIKYELYLIKEMPQVLSKLSEIGYSKLIPNDYFDNGVSLTNEQLDSLDYALQVLFLNKFKGISLHDGKSDRFYPIDKADSSAMRILLRAQRKGNFRLRSDSVFVYQQLYDPGSMPLDSVAAMQIDQCCYGTDIWAWKQLDKLLADAFQDIVIKKRPE